MRKVVLILVLLPFCPRAEAAPAPLPKPEAFAEAVFDAGSAERGRAVAAFLGSRYFLRWARSHLRVKEALPRLPDAELGAWLKANLTATNEGGSVRVRLRGGRPLPLLQVVSDELAGKGRPTENEREIRQLQRLLVEIEGDRMRRNDAQAFSGWGMVEDQPLKLQSAPRAVRVRR